MPRRVNLPGADELFRGPAPDTAQAPEAPPASAPAKRGREPKAAAEPSGRVRHDEKITVYVSRDELLALEHGRLALRSDFSLAVDRGRLVRESVAIVMEDLVARGEQSELVRRLRSQ